MRVDTHTHSTASDSTVSPTALMDEARAAGLDGIGLTDHDTMAGWDEAAAMVAQTGVALIRGVEFSTRYHGITVHMLGYLFDPSDIRIREHIAKMRTARVDRARAMVERISADFPLTWADVEEQIGDAQVVGRPHIADAMVAKGFAADRSEAFERFLKPGGPYFIHYYAPETTDVIGWINDAHGKAVFAHPVAPQRSRMVPFTALDEFAAAGLFGVEIDHPENDGRYIPELTARVQRLGLARFGASDYHGAGKPNRLGEYVTAPEILEDLVAGTYLEVLHE